jgi:MerR family mercuric resistance operon transcriptional regulator
MMTIGELANAAEVPISTVRYYERAGILKAHRRSASNYRLYSEEDAQRLRFIRAAQASGFTLEDMKELLRHRAAGYRGSSSTG